jgi:hypothetical protein
MAAGSTERAEIIGLVMAERDQLARVGSELLELLAGVGYSEDRNSPKRVAINKKILELSKHLANLAGFCDSNGRRAIHIFTTQVLDTSMLKPLYYTYLRALLPTIVGIQVDFTKKPPFKLLQFDFKAWGSQIKAIAQRQ